jgi:uncharacterized repeat protein (TIGR03803 family)
MNLDGSGFRVLHVFEGNGADGCIPVTSLVWSGQVAYGTTRGCGAHGQGTIYSIHSDGSRYEILHSFNGDFSSPEAALIVVGDSLYGTSPLGGDQDSGAVFKFDLVDNQYSVLYAFDSRTEYSPYRPIGSLVFAKGRLFGVTNRGGKLNSGVLFSIDLETLHLVTEGDLGGDPTDLETYQNSLLYLNDEFFGVNQTNGLHASGSLFRYRVP